MNTKNMRKAVYEIDGACFTTLEEFYDEVGRVLLHNVSWGRNIDALNDVLRGGFGTPANGFVLCWKSFDISRQRLGYPETVRQLEKRLLTCHSTAREQVLQQLEQAKQGIGPTVCDWLVEIIRSHGPGGEEEEDGVELVLR